MPLKLFPRLEFHRSGVGLLPDPHQPDPGSAVHLSNVAGSKRPLTFCSCSTGRRSSCRHLQELSRQIDDFRTATDGTSWHDLFAQSAWHRLAQVLYEGDPCACDDTRVLQEGVDQPIRLFSDSEREVVRYLEQSPAAVRFLERTGRAPKTSSFSDRSGLLDRLATFMRTPEEQHLNKAGLQTNRQSFELSLWCRLAYHCLREYGDFVGSQGHGQTVLPAVESRTGELYLTLRSSERTGAEGTEAGASTAVLQLAVPRAVVADTLTLLAELTGTRAVDPIPTTKLFFVGPDTRIEEEMRLPVHRLAALGEEVLEEDTGYEKYSYGELVFLPQLGILVEKIDRGDFDPPEPRSLDLEPARLAAFETLEPVGDTAESVTVDPMSGLGIFTEFDYIELEPEVSQSTEHSLSIRYGFGEDEVSIGELLRAKRAGLPYLETDSGWVDLNAPSLRGLGSLLRRKELSDSLEEEATREDRVKLSSAELLRLQASSAKPIRVEGEGDRSELLERFLSLRPLEPLVVPGGLKSELRPYQKLGAEWLKFLYENRLAGLLCDDMGLGKTHQAMALMVILREQLGIDSPLLVVCPRTVISHWRNKIREYAPILTPVHYHGPQRDLEAALDEGDVLLTSYGVLRNDVEDFAKLEWGLVVFDEVQQIKNRSTQGYQAAAAVPATMKLGLTGTPIENSLAELKGLFDLVLPGYLGGEDDFRDYFAPELDADSWYAANLRRLTAPFVLRRVKTAVLDELPAKIEDVRTCRLSDEQLHMYRQTIETKGMTLMEKLRNKVEPLPYIHIFALLNMLKQICDHPALAVGDLENYTRYESGKWDLFEDLLSESLASGQKVVVFTQYLGMIAIMERHLERMGVGSATLTGASKERGKIVDRFNEEEDCRVFLGSLKAGGTGIDLIGGSVVIHYDRWWNAAREDQATDRLYRIGQKRVVQVFKLITEETLEERIASIIDRKRRLMESVVQEDDPSLNKIFSREELIELLKGPGLDDEPV